MTNNTGLINYYILVNDWKDMKLLLRHLASTKSSHFMYYERCKNVCSIANWLSTIETSITEEQKFCVHSIHESCDVNHSHILITFIPTHPATTGFRYCKTYSWFTSFISTLMPFNPHARQPHITNERPRATVVSAPVC